MLEILIDDTNKDSVDELVTQFIEKIEAEASAKDSQMTKSRNTEWQTIHSTLVDSQHNRGRQIISEIIQTTTNFTNSVAAKFQQFRDDDEEENRWTSFDEIKLKRWLSICVANFSRQRKIKNLIDNKIIYITLFFLVCK